MSFWVYILQSEKTGRHYCGQTNNIDRRISQHNDPEYKSSRTTKVFPGPWKLIWKQEIDNRSEAMKLEKKIKKRGIKRHLETDQLVESRWKQD